MARIDVQEWITVEDCIFRDEMVVYVGDAEVHRMSYGSDWPGEGDLQRKAVTEFGNKLKELLDAKN